MIILKDFCFKPYYNWNTFNTKRVSMAYWPEGIVLNLIITGIPSIQQLSYPFQPIQDCFKPYYNWNTFNTKINGFH